MRRSKGTLYRPVTIRVLGGRRVKRRAAFYWARYVDASGAKQNHVLTLPNGETRITDKDVARATLDAILKRVEREAAGLIDRSVEAAGTPMRIVLARFLRYLRNRQVGRKYIRQAMACIKRLIDDGPMERLAEFRAERIEVALGRLASAKRSPKTVNEYRAYARVLGRWAVKTAKLLAANPVEEVDRRKVQGDVRKNRRALSVDEATRLLKVALIRPREEAAIIRRGKDRGTATARLKPETCEALEREGRERRAFYCVQLWAGLRVGEVAALEWRDVELHGDRPCLKLRAEVTKAKRADALPLHPGLRDVLAVMREVVPFALATDRVFDSTPTLRTFKADLDRAGITWRKDDHDDKASIDRHALRTTFVSWLEAAGVTGSAKRILARHAAVGVTERHYTDARLLDLWSEIRKLPAIPRAAESVSLKAAGTDGKLSDSDRGAGGRVFKSPAGRTPPRARENPVALPVVLSSGISGGNGASRDSMADSGTLVAQRKNSGENHEFSPEIEAPRAQPSS